MLSTALTANGIGLAATILLVRLFPAKRTKDIAIYLSLLFGILLYLVIRLLRPEELAFAFFTRRRSCFYGIPRNGRRFSWWAP